MMKLLSRFRKFQQPEQDILRKALERYYYSLNPQHQAEDVKLARAMLQELPQR